MSSNWELTIQTNNIILIILALASLTRSKYLQIRTLTMGQFRKVVSTLLFACFGIGTALHHGLKDEMHIKDRTVGSVPLIEYITRNPRAFAGARLHHLTGSLDSYRRPRDMTTDEMNRLWEFPNLLSSQIVNGRVGYTEVRRAWLCPLLLG
jgi:hypothetical protein